MDTYFSRNFKNDQNYNIITLGIGGTNTRIQIETPRDQKRIFERKSADYTSFAELLSSALNEEDLVPAETVVRAVYAGPRKPNGSVQLTNVREWDVFYPLQDAERLGLAAALTANDGAATAAQALVILQNPNQFQNLTSLDETRETVKPIAVMGCIIGTGLNATRASEEKGRFADIFGGEAGHLQFPPEGLPHEAKLKRVVAQLSNDHPARRSYVTYESLASLEYAKGLYKAWCEFSGIKPISDFRTKDLKERVEAGDVATKEFVECWSGVLGRWIRECAKKNADIEAVVLFSNGLPDLFGIPDARKVFLKEMGNILGSVEHLGQLPVFVHPMDDKNEGYYTDFSGLDKLWNVMLERRDQAMPVFELPARKPADTRSPA